MSRGLGDVYKRQGELPTLVMLVGATLVISAGVLVIWREHHLGLERRKARSVTDPKA